MKQKLKKQKMSYNDSMHKVNTGMCGSMQVQLHAIY